MIRVAVKIERCNEPTGEQLAASIILTGASALRMMRAERRQMGYIGWKDLEPEEECHILHAALPNGCPGAPRRGAPGFMGARMVRSDLRNLCSRCE